MKVLTEQQKQEKKIKQYIAKNYYHDLPRDPNAQRRLVNLFYPRLNAQGKNNRVPTENACSERIFQVARRIWNEIKKSDFSNITLDQRLLLDSELEYITTGISDLGETVGKYIELNYNDKDFISAFRIVVDNPNYIGYRLRHK